MSTQPIPRYPIYVISKGRHDVCLTAKFLIRDNVDFRLVVEPQELELYAAQFPREKILVLPFSNLGLGGIPARNWCWEHSKAAGHKRHWILDDNISEVRRLYKGLRLPCNSSYGFVAIENFTDQYENIGISGMNYMFFVMDNMPQPFFLNCHVYSCLLIDNDLPVRWRGRYNEDTDLCLQVLALGLCTVLVNQFMIAKMRTMTMKGGNSDQLYQGDGRLRMARSLERVWPHVVHVDRRYDRPQHVVREQWKKFDTPLIRRKDCPPVNKPNDLGMKLVPVKAIKSPVVKQLIESQGEAPPG